MGDAGSETLARGRPAALNPSARPRSLHLMDLETPLTPPRRRR